MPTATAAEPSPVDATGAPGWSRTGWSRTVWRRTVWRRTVWRRTVWTSAVSAQSVAAARIGFGVLVAFGALRFLANGWVESLYLAPDHHLTYPGFDWVRPWPEPLMYLHLVGLAVLGLAIAAGYRTRLAAGLFVVGFTYVELIDATLYLNHYWFMTLMGVLMTALPVAGHWSLDARSGRVAPSPVVGLWVVWALRAQVAVVYVFAGLAKLNPDWLLRAQPLRLWLADHTDLPLVGPFMDEPIVAYLASWSGAAFDLTIVGWLLWPRTRRFAFAAVVVFHAVTGALFPIGIFPWVMGVSALVFFAPDWPSRLMGRPQRLPTDPSARQSVPARPAMRRFLVALMLIELALPLRHYALDGNVRWNEEGYYLAWRVMLTEKAGSLEFLVTDPATGDTWEVGPDAVLTDWQTTQAAIRPDLIRRTALLIEADLDRSVEVRARSWVSFNGRRAVPLVDPDVDLTGPLPDDWIRSSP